MASLQGEGASCLPTPSCYSNYNLATLQLLAATLQLLTATLQLLAATLQLQAATLQLLAATLQPLPLGAEGRNSSKLLPGIQLLEN